MENEKERKQEADPCSGEIQDPRIRRFSRTCSLLSKYLKDGGTIDEISTHFRHPKSHDVKAALPLLTGVAPVTSAGSGNEYMLLATKGCSHVYSESAPVVKLEICQKRRASLQQFLAKRKDRIRSKAPYLTNCTNAVSSKSESDAQKLSTDLRL